jgi:hypothetical protein
MRRIEADQIEELGDPFAPLGLRADAMNYERLFDDGERAHARVERRVRVLEHHLHLTPGRAHPPARESEDVLAAEPHFARGWLDQAQHAAAGRALAAARFADERERLALLH